MSLEFETLGLLPYESARTRQEQLVTERVSGALGDTVLFCEHPPVITIGKRGTTSQVRASISGLDVPPVVRVGRGGQVTLHSPGQLLVYPVISLRDRQMGVKDFALRLLKAANGVLNHFEVEGSIDCEAMGVFVRGKKLVSMGLQITHGVTNHGLSFNVMNDLSLFSLIVPCGRSDISMGSLFQELNRDIRIEEVEMSFRSEFSAVLV